MIEVFSHRRGATIYMLVWLFFGVALGAVIALASATPLANAMLFAIPMNLLYAFVAGYSAYYLCRAYPLGVRPAGAIAAVLTVAAMVSGGLWLLLGTLWNTLTVLPDVAWAGIVLTPQLSALIVGLGILLYGFAAAVHYLVIEFVRARSAERRELESMLMAQEAELRMLRTQIDPHFLFNSLNSISALTSSDAGAARRMTLALASFFRQSLGMEAHKMVPLSEELILIRHFLAIEQVRFGDRLQVECAVDEMAGACLVPPMLIQPLVENAVKHGICQLPEGGVIRIAARRAGSLLHISVANPCDAELTAAGSNSDSGSGSSSGSSGSQQGAGIGLANVRQRLAGAYKHEASIVWSRQQDHSNFNVNFTVDIAMPAHTTQDRDRE